MDAGILASNENGECPQRVESGHLVGCHRGAYRDFGVGFFPCLAVPWWWLTFALAGTCPVWVRGVPIGICVGLSLC